MKSILLDAPYFKTYNLPIKLIFSKTVDNLHIVQMQILRELVFHPNSKFSQLNLAGLSNDHFSYHIKKLIELNLVIKEGNKYSLSKKGKMYSAKMDTDNMKMEKQPKIGVLISPVMIKGGKKMFVIQQRLKEPYYGYWGFITGKVKWGEKIPEAALRELKEETGLEGTVKPSFVFHEMVYDKEGNLLEDKYFHCVRVVVTNDTLKEKEEGCANKWMTKKEFMNISPKYHSEDEIFEWFENEKIEFTEQTYFIEKF